MEQGDYFTRPFTKPTYDHVEEPWKQEFQRQDSEVIHWLDDFLESDDYAEALQRKICDASLTTPSHPSRINILKHDFRLSASQSTVTPMAHHMASLEAKMEGTLSRLHIANTIANQCKAISIIKEKIMEVRNQHSDAVSRGILQKFEEKRQALNILRKDYHVSLASDELSSKILDKILKLRHSKKNRQKNREKNRVSIIAKIVHEMNLERKLKRPPKYRSKVRRFRKRKQSKSESVTSKLESYIPPVEQSNLSISLSQYVSPSKESMSSEASLEVATLERSKITESKIPSETLTSKEITSQKTKNIEGDVIPEFIPIVNTRRKYIAENNLNQLLEDMARLHKYLKDKEDYELEMQLGQDIELPLDVSFYSNPNKIIFKDYVPGKIYKKIIGVVNGGSYIKKIHFERFIWNGDIEEETLLEVESFGIYKVLPGMSFRLTLKFAPEVVNKTIDGKLIFITERCGRNHRLYQYILHIVCVPKCASVSIKPTVISFDELPIWRARQMQKMGQNYKTITIVNNGLKECKIVISKIFNAQTIEQEWRKIISIIRIDGSNTESKTLSMASMHDPAEADPFPRNLVQQCVENVFNIFKFERNVFNVQPKTSMTIKCWFKDMSESGYQVESYTFSVYERFTDGQLYCIGTQDVIVNSETTEHFLEANVELLDFEVCAYGSIYQLEFDVINPCKLPHHIRIAFPSNMRPYLQSNIRDATIQPKESLKVYIKFMPTAGILERNKYYDPEVKLLEFPIYVAVHTKGYEDTPPLKVDAYAVVTEAKGIVVSMVDNEAHHFDMGECSVMESIYTEILVQNVSLIPQQFGFLSLPPYVTLAPNHGFGKLQPQQKAVLRVLLSPTKQDVTNSDGCLHFQLIPTSMKYSGAIKKKPNTKSVLNKLKHMEDFVCRSSGDNNSKLRDDIQALRDIMQSNSQHKTTAIVQSNSSSMDKILQVFGSTEQLLNVVKYDIEEEKSVASYMDDGYYALPPTPASSQSTMNDGTVVSMRTHVVDICVELSHQIIHFPDTPCGSMSWMTVDLVGNRCGTLGCRYVATFEITGGNGDDDEFQVQPTYGQISSKERREITVFVRPRVPKFIVEERIRYTKMEAKRREMHEQQQHNESLFIPHADTKKRRGKSPKQVKVKKLDNKDSVEDITVGYEDFYQAEIAIWRTIQPYLIEKVFKCRVTYKDHEGNSLDQGPEDLYLRATCQVVQPDFIHDQNFQVIDFGTQPVGMSCTKIINLQNIQRKKISIDVSPTNPVGPYSCPVNTPCSVPSEFILRYPIKFAPMSEGRVVEFLDVTSGLTSYPFILTGIGIEASLSFNPDFFAFRLLTDHNSTHADCTFDAINQSQVVLEVTFQKVLEIEGAMLGIKKEEKKKTAGKTTPPKKPKFSKELYPEEVDAIENNFEARQDSPVFHVMGNGSTENSFMVEPFAKCVIRIRFGNILADEDGKDSEISKKKEVKKPTKKKKAKDKETLKGQLEKGKSYLVKYNIFVGSKYIKDIVIIATVD